MGRTMQATANRKLADLLLGEAGPLEEFVAARRPKSWRLIARDLLEATDGKVDVTHETLRQWFPEHQAKAAS